jgi:dTDP-glucose 4,6-dehydratase
MGRCAMRNSETLLILGANSFAGGQLVAAALSTYCQVIGVNRSAETSPLFLPYLSHPERSRYQFYALDINRHCDELLALLEQQKPAVIIDLAGQGMVAESWQAPQQWYTTNLVAKARLHDFLKDQTWLQRYIRVSTPEVYGSQTSLQTESFHYNPSTPYAVSHAAVDMHLMAYYRQFDFPVTLTRFSNFYGPGQQLYRIIPRTIIYALTGRTLQLHGGGLAQRAFIYGADVASALLKTAALGKAGEVYHFSSSQFVSIASLVEIICKQLAIPVSELVEVSPDRPGKDANYFMDDQKARRQLGWEPQYKLEQGIANTIEWVKTHLAEIQTLPLNYQHKE